MFIDRLVRDNQNILISEQMREGLAEKDAVDCAMEEDIKEAEPVKEIERKP